MTPRVVLIANPGTKRCEAFVRAARGCGIEPVVVPWADVIPAGGDLDHLHEFDQPAVVRLESPGKDAAVTRLLLAAGDPHTDWPAVPLAKGLLLRPGLQHQGFTRALAGLRKSFDARPHLAPTVCPLAVARMFDKNGTLADLSAADVPVPEFLPLQGMAVGWRTPPPPSSLRSDRRPLPGGEGWGDEPLGEAPTPPRRGGVAGERSSPAGVGPFPPNDTALPTDPETLLAVVRGHGWPVAYLKLNTGASGTGIVVARFDGSAWAGTTTLLRRGSEFFNTRRLQAVSGAELRACVAFLLREGITVQRGVPHAQLDGQNADLRVVCIGGKPVATVFRLSPHPLTNLHLGGRRGDWQRCRDAIPTRCWLDALDSASAAAGCFDSLMVGVDVVFEPGFRRHAVLEVNAFGDFFPGWTDPAGRSLYQLEFDAAHPRPLGTAKAIPAAE